MRLPSESSAVLEMGSGKELRCRVHDLSMGGAYMLREAIDGQIPSLRRGEWVQTHQKHPDREEATSVYAEVIRVEETPGPGVALRFQIDEETAAGVISHVNMEADRQNVAHDELGAPLVMKKQQTSTLRSMTPLLMWGVAVVVLLALLYLLKDYLGAIL
jgi:hypothetical protein